MFTPSKTATTIQLQKKQIKTTSKTGVIILPTQTMHYKGKSLKITTDLHCLIPKNGYINDPWQNTLPQKEINKELATPPSTLSCAPRPNRPWAARKQIHLNIKVLKRYDHHWNISFLFGLICLKHTYFPSKTHTNTHLARTNQKSHLLGS